MLFIETKKILSACINCKPGWTTYKWGVWVKVLGWGRQISASGSVVVFYVSGHQTAKPPAAKGAAPFCWTPWPPTPRVLYEPSSPHPHRHTLKNWWRISWQKNGAKCPEKPHSACVLDHLHPTVGGLQPAQQQSASAATLLQPTSSVTSPLVDQATKSCSVCGCFPRISPSLVNVNFCAEFVICCEMCVSVTVRCVWLWLWDAISRLYVVCLFLKHEPNSKKYCISCTVHFSWNNPLTLLKI